MNTGRQRAYLRRLMRMSPLDSAAEILAARRVFKNPDDDSPFFEAEEEDAEARIARREAMEQRIERLLQMFWKWDDQQLAVRLDGLHVAEFPDLALAVGRMREVARLRDSFRRLGSHPNCCPDFFNFFRRLVIAPARFAARLRAEDRHNLWESASARYVLRRNSQSTAATIQAEFPELFELEPDWLIRMRTPPPPSSTEPMFSEDTTDTIFGVVAIAVIVTVIAVYFSL